MKTLFLRTIALIALAGASWAVWAAEGDSPRSLPKPSLAKPATLKVGKPTPADANATAQLSIKSPAATTSPPVSSSTAVHDPAAVANPAASTTAALPPRSSIDVTGAPLQADTSVHLSLSTLAPTPEMWFYEQMRQDYNNPQLQARLRAERYAAERRARMAARAWYGVSNSRPTANVTPFMYYYSPFWGSNTANPNVWSGRHTTQVIIEARRPAVNVSGFGVW